MARQSLVPVVSALRMRVSTLTVSAATYTVNTGTTDMAIIASPTANFTISSTGPTPQDGDQMTIRLRSGTTAWAITWAAQFVSSGDVALPGSGVASKTVHYSFFWDSAARSGSGGWVIMAAQTIGY